MQQYHNSIFWVETDKIKPNPFQPRKEFDQNSLQDLADSIRQYGVLQPLVVTRKEIEKPDGGLAVEYELIAGERRLRASKLAALPQVPVIIRATHEDDKMKLELAIIENLQREDLNPIDRARAFLRLYEEFKLTHGEIGKKMGKSREYVSNTLRLLTLPQEIMDALGEKRISEGHTRPLMMLSDRPDQQITLFKEIAIKKLSVREAERIARSIATEKTRKKDENFDPELAQYQARLAESLGTRVSIEKRNGNVGGKIVIDYFSPSDLETILQLLKSNEHKGVGHMMEGYIQQKNQEDVSKKLEEMPVQTAQPFAPEIEASPESSSHVPEIFAPELMPPISEPEMETPKMMDDRTHQEIKEGENEDLYNIGNFTI
jgi:ParB family transcriptional regulator, chromosome partitioning protein